MRDENFNIRLQWSFAFNYQSPWKYNTGHSIGFSNVFPSFYFVILPFFFFLYIIIRSSSSFSLSFWNQCTEFGTWHLVLLDPITIILSDCFSKAKICGKIWNSMDSFNSVIISQIEYSNGTSLSRMFLDQINMVSVEIKNTKYQ